MDRSQSQIVLLTAAALILLFGGVAAALSYCKGQVENQGGDPEAIADPTVPPTEQLANLIVALLSHNDAEDLMARARALMAERPFAMQPLETRHPNAVAIVAICGDAPCGSASGVALGPNSRGILTAGHVVDGMASQGATSVCVLFNQYADDTKNLRHCDALIDVQERLLIFDPMWQSNPDAVDLGGITLSKTPAELGAVDVTSVVLADNVPAQRTLMFAEPNASPDDPTRYTDRTLPATERLMMPIDAGSARFVSSMILTTPDVTVNRDNFMEVASEYFAPIRRGSSGTALFRYQAGPSADSTKARHMVLHGILEGPYVTPVARLQQSKGMPLNYKDQIAMTSLQELEASGIAVDPSVVFLQMVFVRVDQALQMEPTPQEFIEFLQARQ